MRKLISTLFAALTPLLICGCAETTESIPQTIEASAETTGETLDQTDESIFPGTLEALPQPHELTSDGHLSALEISPSAFFTPGVWTSTYSDTTGNFYVFDEDGIHGELIPMSDADSIGFVYSISGSSMTLYVGDELTPYSAEIERTDDGKVLLSMTYLGTQDVLEYLWEVPESGFTFYPAKTLAKKAEKYYTDLTGTTLAGVAYRFSDDDMVILDLWVRDENGWREDVESYTVSMFTAAGWSSISFDDVDLSGVVVETTEELSQVPNDDIPDIEEPVQ